jgi:hypothetical protein
MEIDIDIPQHMTLVELSAFYYEEVDVTMRSHRFPRGGPEKNDSLWLRHCDNALNDLLEYCLSDLSHSCYLTASLTLNIAEQRKDAIELFVDPIVYAEHSKS